MRGRDLLLIDEGTPGVCAGIFVHGETLISWLQEVADTCLREDEDVCASWAFSAVADDLREKLDLAVMENLPVQLVTA